MASVQSSRSQTLPMTQPTSAETETTEESARFRFKLKKSGGKLTPTSHATKMRKNSVEPPPKPDIPLSMMDDQQSTASLHFQSITPPPNHTNHTNNHSSTGRGDELITNEVALDAKIKGITIYRPLFYGNISVPLLTPPTHAHDSSSMTHDWYRWTAYVRGFEDEDLSYCIQKVVFRLHDDFDNPIRVVEKPPFEVSEDGWGCFDLMIEIHFYDARETYAEQQLKLVQLYQPLPNEYESRSLVNSPPVARHNRKRKQPDSPWSPEFEPPHKKHAGLSQISTTTTTATTAIESGNDDGGSMSVVSTSEKMQRKRRRALADRQTMSKQTPESTLGEHAFQTLDLEACVLASRHTKVKALVADELSEGYTSSSEIVEQIPSPAKLKAMERKARVSRPKRKENFEKRGENLLFLNFPLVLYNSGNNSSRVKSLSRKRVCNEYFTEAMIVNPTVALYQKMVKGPHRVIGQFDEYRDFWNNRVVDIAEEEQKVIRQIHAAHQDLLHLLKQAQTRYAQYTKAIKHYSSIAKETAAAQKKKKKKPKKNNVISINGNTTAMTDGKPATKPKRKYTRRKKTNDTSTTTQSKTGGKKPKKPKKSAAANKIVSLSATTTPVTSVQSPPKRKKRGRKSNAVKAAEAAAAAATATSASVTLTIDDAGSVSVASTVCGSVDTTMTDLSAVTQKKRGRKRGRKKKAVSTSSAMAVDSADSSERLSVAPTISPPFSWAAAVCADSVSEDNTDLE